MKRVQERSNNQNFGEEEPKKVFIQVKMTARCLFGAPDPAQNEQLIRKVHSTKKWAFERKWNFRIDTESEQQGEEKKSPPSKILQSSNQEICYEWEGPFHYHDNYVGKCDDESADDDGNRYQVESSSLVPLLAAGPIFHNDQDMAAGPATVKVDTGVTEDASNTDLIISSRAPGKCEKSPGLIRTGQNSPISSGSITPSPFTGRIPTKSSQAKARRICPTTPTCESPEMVSPDDLVFTFPSTLKQRCITDYLKVKKVPRVK